MARRFISTNTGRSTGKKKSLGRRRSNRMAKIKYGRPTARNQKKQILGNARRVNTLMRQYNNSKVYTDWKSDLWIVGGLPTTFNWAITPITDVFTWQPVMRSNITVDRANHTFVRGVQMTLNFQLGTNVTSQFVNCFLVRPRYPTANRDFVTDPLQPDIDWIQNSQNEGEMLHLNPSLFKVLAKKQFRLMTNTPGLTSLYPNQVAGDLSNVSRRWEWNLKLNMKLSSPDAANWRSIPFKEMPYYNKIYLAIYVSDQSAIVGQNVGCNCTTRFTCINVE